MSNGLRVVAALMQAEREGGEARGGLGGQRVAGLLGPEALGVGEGVPQQVALRPVEEVVEREGVDLLDGVCPVGPDQDAVHVGHDEERRVIERASIAEELIEGWVERAAEALVLPPEATFAPDVGPALA